ncbi:GAF domain-containing protein [Glaciecola siphonariae]|uniref:GAF domain-containing protein n=1 Tax=Glaciecola siphonariae TaxID=521012 RepID=A0ABV9LTZ4_9ALTE
MYTLLCQQAKAIIDGEFDQIANFANISALLFNQLENVNWAGFYIYKDNELVLGPFQGQVACIRIPMGKGVCGTAAASLQTQLVDDVHEFAGHIACDAASNSEIVIPIVINKALVGVLDIDSPLVARFDEQDKKGLEALVALVVKHYEGQP